MLRMEKALNVALSLTEARVVREQGLAFCLEKGQFHTSLSLLIQL